MILNSHNSRPQSTAAKGATATFWCLIRDIAASNLLICISGGNKTWLCCSSPWPYMCCQPVCLSDSPPLKILMHNTHDYCWGTFGMGIVLVSGKESMCIKHLHGTNMSCRQRNPSCILFAIRHISFANNLKMLTSLSDKVIVSALSLSDLSSSLSLSDNFSWKNCTFWRHQSYEWRHME